MRRPFRSKKDFAVRNARSRREAKSRPQKGNGSTQACCEKIARREHTGNTFSQIGCGPRRHFPDESGRTTVAVVSRAGSETKWIVPPCAVTIHFAMLSP